MVDFIQSNRVGVLAVQLVDGSPHAATVHFAHQEDPLSLIILTERSYKKCEALLKGDKVKSSFVIGTDEEKMKTLQLDGEIKIIEDDQVAKKYFDKFNSKGDNFEPPEDVFLLFTPTWWRFTDWTKPEGKTSLDSEGRIVVYD